jgi:hypothetical protein
MQRNLHSSGLRKFIVGALIGASVFLIIAGISEIMIVQEAECHAEAMKQRLVPNKFEFCYPEWQSYFIRAAARGAPWAIDTESSPMVGWLVMGSIFALVGGACAQLSLEKAIPIFIVFVVGSVAFFAGLGYVLQYIVF